MFAGRAILKEMNRQAEIGNGHVEADEKRKEYVVFDENGEEVYHSPSASDIGSWLDFRNAFGIPYSAKPTGKRR
jgi:hypothetical protein